MLGYKGTTHNNTLLNKRLIKILMKDFLSVQLGSALSLPVVSYLGNLLLVVVAPHFACLDCELVVNMSPPAFHFISPLCFWMCVWLPSSSSILLPPLCPPAGC